MPEHHHLKAAIVVGVNSNHSPVLSALSSNSNAFLSYIPYLPLHSHYLSPPLYLSLSHLLYLPFSLSLSPHRPLSEIYSSQEQLRWGARVSNLWFNKTYISLAGVLYVPHPSPFGGFMEGLWIAGWFRSPLSCLWPVRATTHSPQTSSLTGQMFVRLGSGWECICERNTDTIVKPCLGWVQVCDILFINPGNGALVLASLLM